MVNLSKLNKDAEVLCSKLEVLLEKVIVHVVKTEEEKLTILDEYNQSENSVDLVLINLCEPENV